MKHKALGIAFNTSVVGGVLAIYNGQALFTVSGLLLLVTVCFTCAGFAARN